MNEFANLSRWVIGSILLHLLFLAQYLFNQPAPLVTTAVVKSTRLSLGIATALAGANTHSPPQTPAIKVKSTQPIQMDPPPPPTKETFRKPTQSVLPPRPLVSKNIMQDIAEKNDPKQEALSPSPARVASKEGQQGDQGSRQSNNKQIETGQAQQHGSQELSDQFDLAVRRHLLAHKKTPKILSGRQHGIVVVEFVIDRQGEIVSQDIGTPSQVREFDRAAHLQVASAAPYPRPPAELHWQERRYQIAIHYQSQ
ncbi:TonB family protein [Iodobacter ciconiae]|uniref:Energy transducer TonB n=1 Tax=Iodobacter ciconiae TaxID=2496266 RepID=A0A3S8ZUN9_9NEIS|nr:TonB family protein [Iodobacter ciconiae]AZN37154.1 energy transducer TonB [Iodobacter ciconiae]